VKPLPFLLLALCACKTISLSNDPTAPEADRHLSPQSLYEIDWWRPLVKGTLLEYQPAETASPAIDPETQRVVVGTRDGFLRSLSPVDGHVEWEFKANSRFFAGATIEQGVVYAPGGDGVLYALRARNGELIWQYNAAEELVTPPVLVDGKVLVTSQGDTLFVVDAATGKWVWQYRRDPPPGFTVRGAATPVVHEGIVYQGFSDGSEVALTLEAGVVKWERKITTTGGTAFLDVDSPAVLDDAGHLFVASYKDGVTALDAKTGDLIWTTVQPGITTLIARGDVLFTAGDGAVGALRTTDGRSLWTLDLSDKGKKFSNAGRPPVLLKGMLVVPTSSALVFVDPAAGRARSAWNPGKGITATPARSGSRLYVMSNLGTVFAMRLKGGAN
jgi:outer membrane protein assembly factor BamB